MKHFLNKTLQKPISKNKYSLVLQTLKYQQINSQTYGKMKYEKLIYLTLESTKSNKTPGNDGLTKQFFKTFWDEPKTSLVESIN